MSVVPYSFTDYRVYLRALMEQERARNPVFSYRFFARVAGFSSPSYLKMVLDGQRNLSPSSIQQFAKAFKLGRQEAAYFESLVLFNQARSEKEQELYFERLTALRPRTTLRGLERDQFEYYTRKHFVIIREMVALPHFREDPAWIGKCLNPPLKAKDVEAAIAVLLRLDLLRRDATGKLTQCDEGLTTAPEVASIELMSFHRAMLDDAKEALFRIGPERRDISALTIPIPKQTIPELKRRIREFREQILELINRGTADYHEVYQLNIQLFPLTKTRDE